MVKFALLNELSLPFKTDIDIEYHFNSFLYLIKSLKEKNIEKIRIDRNFKEFEILPGVFFQQFFGQIRDKELKDKLRTFLTNRTVKIESPLIFEYEQEYEQTLENEYFYNDISTIGALACCDIWNSMSISFNSDKAWNMPYIEITKQTLLDVDTKRIQIKNVSTISHLRIYQDFFIEIEKCIRLEVTPSNFWDKKDTLFRKKIILCNEVSKQINNLDTIIFAQALSILRDIESGVRSLNDFTTSAESESVRQDKNLKNLRMFYIDGEKEYFAHHIKNLSNGYRIYYLEKNSKIYIGYIGKHLKSKKY